MVVELEHLWRDFEEALGDHSQDWIVEDWECGLNPSCHKVVETPQLGFDSLRLEFERWCVVCPKMR